MRPPDAGGRRSGRIFTGKLSAGGDLSGRRSYNETPAAGPHLVFVHGAAGRSKCAEQRMIGVTPTDRQRLIQRSRKDARWEMSGQPAVSDPPVCAADVAQRHTPVKHRQLHERAPISQRTNVQRKEQQHRSSDDLTCSGDVPDLPTILAVFSCAASLQIKNLSGH